MTFNQWAASRHLDNSCRLSFEAVWNAMTAGACSPGEASSLLTDLMQSLPELQEAEYEDDE